MAANINFVKLKTYLRENNILIQFNQWAYVFSNYILRNNNPLTYTVSLDQYSFE